MLWLDQKRVFAMVYHRLKSSYVLLCFVMLWLTFLLLIVAMAMYTMSISLFGIEDLKV